jgi:hypothetical protein
MTITVAPNPNPQWVDDSRIDLDVILPTGERARYTADWGDMLEEGRNLFDMARSGDFGAVAPAPEPPAEDPQWANFVAAVRETAAFSRLRYASRQSLVANALATELRILLGEAAAGNPSITEMQALFDAFPLSKEEKGEVDKLLNIFFIPLNTVEELSRG